jgi:predicted PurR-regulated permease PerM
MDIGFATVVVLVSEIVACWIIYRVWRSEDFLFFKVAYSAIAVVPVLGPILVLGPLTFRAACRRSYGTNGAARRMSSTVGEESSLATACPSH